MEGVSACGGGILPGEEVLCLWKRYSACGGGILPVEEMYPCGREILPVGEMYACGRDVSLWERCIPVGWLYSLEKMENENFEK